MITKNKFSSAKISEKENAHSKKCDNDSTNKLFASSTTCEDITDSSGDECVGDVVFKLSETDNTEYCKSKLTLNCGEDIIKSYFAKTDFNEPITINENVIKLKIDLNKNGIEQDFDLDFVETVQKLSWTSDNASNNSVSLPNFIGAINNLKFTYEGELSTPDDTDAGVLIFNHASSQTESRSIPQLITYLASQNESQVLISLNILSNILQNRYTPSAFEDSQVPKDCLNQNIVVDLVKFDHYLFSYLQLHEKLLFLISSANSTKVKEHCLICMAYLFGLSTFSILEKSDLSSNNFFIHRESKLQTKSITMRDFFFDADEYSDKMRALRCLKRNDDNITVDNANKGNDLSNFLFDYLNSENQLAFIQENLDAEDINYMRTDDPLASLLLWGQNTSSVGFIAEICKRLIYSKNELCISACLWLLVQFALHSSTLAKLVIDCLFCNSSGSVSALDKSIFIRFVNFLFDKIILASKNYAAHSLTLNLFLFLTKHLILSDDDQNIISLINNDDFQKLVQVVTIDFLETAHRNSFAAKIALQLSLVAFPKYYEVKTDVFMYTLFQECISASANKTKNQKHLQQINKWLLEYSELLYRCISIGCELKLESFEFPELLLVDRYVGLTKYLLQNMSYNSSSIHLYISFLERTKDLQNQFQAEPDVFQIDCIKTQVRKFLCSEESLNFCSETYLNAARNYHSNTITRYFSFNEFDTISLKHNHYWVVAYFAVKAKLLVENQEKTIFDLANTVIQTISQVSSYSSITSIPLIDTRISDYTYFLIPFYHLDFVILTASAISPDFFKQPDSIKTLALCSRLTTVLYCLEHIKNFLPETVQQNLLAYIFAGSGLQKAEVPINKLFVSSNPYNFFSINNYFFKLMKSNLDANSDYCDTISQLINIQIEHCNELADVFKLILFLLDCSLNYDNTISVQEDKLESTRYILLEKLESNVKGASLLLFFSELQQKTNPIYDELNESAKLTLQRIFDHVLNSKTISHPLLALIALSFDDAVIEEKAAFSTEQIKKFIRKVANDCFNTYYRICKETLLEITQ